ncbi:MAG: DNA-directed RNA polymerase subunit D [Candidatus Hadarchaeota archaeon]|nr:DNA-directed RNA polymerase subunit D [Candidatus Hadarchaeota archaeon]
MELRVLKRTPDEMEFVLSGTNPAFANTLRRTMLREVPTMAVDGVDFVVNDSVMYDEILAHRMGLVPLRTPTGYLLPEECDCRDNRCPKCSVSLTLKKEGPAVVRSGDFESSDERVVPASDSIPIARLGEGQRLELTAIAHLGLGKVHAKWQPGVVSYKYMPTLDLNQELCSECSARIEECPRKLLEKKEEDLTVGELQRRLGCIAGVEICPEDGNKVGHDPTKFIFRVESSGAMPPEQMVERATKVLEDKSKEFVKKLKKV